MTKEIIDTLSEIIALLDDCDLPAWATKYSKWKQEITANANNPERVKDIYKELYVASAPRGFLGDFPLNPSKENKLTYELIELRRMILVDRLITQLRVAGIRI